MDKPIPLSEEEIQNNLKDLSGWTYEVTPPAGGKIKKEFKFNDFMDSLGFVNQLAPFFESQDHHPDTHIFYNRILFELQRFDIGGKVTDRDFTVAKKIEEEYGKR